MKFCYHIEGPKIILGQKDNILYESHGANSKNSIRTIFISLKLIPCCSMSNHIRGSTIILGQKTIVRTMVMVKIPKILFGPSLKVCN